MDSQSTVVSNEYVCFWPKNLLFRTQTAYFANPNFYKHTNYFFYFWVRAVVKITAILLTYPTFECSWTFDPQFLLDFQIISAKSQWSMLANLIWQRNIFRRRNVRFRDLLIWLKKKFREVLSIFQLKAIRFVNSVCTIFSLRKQGTPHETFPS